MDRMAQRGRFRFLSWLGGHERTMLLALAGIVTGVWLFALLADGHVESVNIAEATRRYGDKSLLWWRNNAPGVFW